jgi:micrococcal nuclease
MSLRRVCALLGCPDSDTLRVEWEGQPRSVRLQDVNPEKARPGGTGQPSAFGRRTLAWLQQNLLKEVERVDLEFPCGRVGLSNSGKLLCYVHAGGQCCNVRMVREGYSPCFEKYGYPQVHRAEMYHAEMWARLEGRGIWGGLGGRGDYAALKCYWGRRAGQVEACRHAITLGEDILDCRRDYEQIAERARAGAEACVFGDLCRPFILADGCVLIQVGSPRQSFAAYFGAAHRSLAAFVEREFTGSGKPNYVYLHGRLCLADGQPQITIESLEQVRACPPHTTG